MNFTLSEEQIAIADMARSFGADNIAPFAAQWERDGTIPRDVLMRLGELGLGAMFVAEEDGGIGLSRLDGTLIFEALAEACPSVASFVSIHNMCTWMVARFGTAELKDKWLSKMISMEAIGSYCLTEPGSGSDAAALKTKAERTNEGFVMNGTKSFISGGGYSDLYIVMSRTGQEGPGGISAIVVEDGTPGLSFGAPEDKMGWRSQPTAEVQMSDCRVPASNLLGEEGSGFKYAMMGLDGGRLNIAGAALGGAQSAMNKTLSYMAERKAFGKTINQFQGLQFRLADMETQLQAARVFLRQAASRYDAGEPDATRHCAMAKKFVTDSAFEVANQALQLHGGYGYLADYGIEKIVRDLRVHQILEGSNEIMRVIIARSLISEHAS